MKVLAFRLWGDFAHFRRHYTTSSPLTHSLSPPSALRGLVAAILGLSREDYPEVLSPDRCRFGVRLLKPVKKIRLGLNYMDTKDGSWVSLDLKQFRPKTKEGRLHTQVRMEFLKNPAFEIYFAHEDRAVLEELSARLRERRVVFTPYLGITECLANFEFLWEKEVKPASAYFRIMSAFKSTALINLSLEEGGGLIKEALPLFIDRERKRQATVEAVFDPRGRPILAKLSEAFLYPGQTEEAFCFLG